MFERVQQVLCEILDIDPSLITRQTNIKNDLHADSLTQLELQLMLEKELKIKFPKKEAEKLRDVGYLVDFLEKNAK